MKRINREWAVRRGRTLTLFEHFQTAWDYAQAILGAVLLYWDGEHWRRV